ncbi:MAG: hypothetical protein IJ094_12735 [Bacilli bacterium]|nr:hypothetical protein [Bacilli bacterium]
MELKFINIDELSRQEKDLMLKNMEDYKDKAYNYGMIDLNCTKEDALDILYNIKEINDFIEYNYKILEDVYNKILKKEDKLEFYENLYEETDYISEIIHSRIMIRILERKLKKLYTELEEGNIVQDENISDLRLLESEYRYICSNVSHKKFIDYVEEELIKELKK